MNHFKNIKRYILVDEDGMRNANFNSYTEITIIQLVDLLLYYGIESEEFEEYISYFKHLIYCDGCINLNNVRTFSPALEEYSEIIFLYLQNALYSYLGVSHIYNPNYIDTRIKEFIVITLDYIFKL